MPFASMLLAAGAVLADSAPPDAFASARCGVVAAPEEVLQRLNAARARGAVCRRAGALAVAAPLQWSVSLTAAAQAQSEDMAQLNRMVHRDRLDRGLAERLGAIGYRFATAVENIAVGYDSLDEVVEAWLESESHCVNLMNARVREIGLACVDGPTRDDRYWTLILGASRQTR